MSGELKNTFQEPEVLDKGSPRGLISAWSGGYFTDTDNGGFTNVLGNSVANANSYLNSLGWWVCDGSEVNESESPIFNGAGRHVPNLTDSRFLMGSTSVGGVGGSNTLLDHTHTNTLSGDSHVHAINHTHSNGTAASAGNHRHSAVYMQAGIELPYGGYSAGWSTTAGYNLTNRNMAYTSYAGAHTHSVTIPAHAGDSGGATVNISGTVGTGSAPTSTENRPKYLSCLYIIKVK